MLAIVHIMDLLGGDSKRVVIDMAPTGHTLDLLRTPQRILAWTRLLLKTLAAHRTLDFARDAGVKVAELGQRVRELLDLLKDPERSCIYTVMLPEPLPDRETERLMHDLGKLGLPSNSMFINRVLFVADTGKCQCCRRTNAAKSPQGLVLPTTFACSARAQNVRRSLSLFPMRPCVWAWMKRVRRRGVSSRSAGTMWLSIGGSRAPSGGRRVWRGGDVT